MCRATVQSDKFWLHSWWFVFFLFSFAYLFLFVFSSCCFFVFFVVVVGFLLFYLFVYLFFIRDGGGTKIGFFTGGWVIGVEALIRRILGVLGELGIIISAGQSNWEFSCFGWGVGRCEVASEKINWVIIRIKLCWSFYILMSFNGLWKAFSKLFIL